MELILVYNADNGLHACVLHFSLSLNHVACMRKFKNGIKESIH